MSRNIYKQFHISVKNIVSFNYLEKFLNDEKLDLFEMTKKVLEGYNKNEVLIVNKSKLPTNLTNSQPQIQEANKEEQNSRGKLASRAT